RRSGPGGGERRRPRASEKRRAGPGPDQRGCGRPRRGPGARHSRLSPAGPRAHPRAAAGAAAGGGAAPDRSPPRCQARPRRQRTGGSRGRPAQDRTSAEHGRAGAPPPPPLSRPPRYYPPTFGPSTPFQDRSGMRRFLVLGLALVAGPLQSQTAAPGASARAAATITAADVARRIGIIADDSMLGRDTPSRGLELTAAYVAKEFRRFGLRPGGDDGGWLQRYHIKRRKLDAASSRVLLAAGGIESVARFDRTARYVQGAVPDAPVRGPAVLVGGRLSPDDVGRMALRDKVVVYVADFMAPPSGQAAQVGRALRLAGPKGVLLVANLQRDAFAARIPKSVPARTAVDLKLASPPYMEVSEAAVGPALRAAGVDLD